MRSLLRTCLAVALAAAGLAPADAPGGPVDFARDVRPILESRCYSCHDSRKQTSGLRLDLRARALRGGESGKAAVVPGSSAQSELARRISLAAGDEAMPPGKNKLTAQQIATLKAWIDAGAAWPDALAGDAPGAGHWAFRPPVRPPLPAVKNAAWPRNAIDHFVLARLEKDGLAPSPEADPITLLRRLSLDLTGLPPTPAEADAFAADRSGRAYTLAVTRLLSSPHFGERWAAPWLDAARYADSDGFEKDKARQVWFYRDWVINAFNRDLPYDRFVTEQLAGDLLPGATQEQVVATGYLRNSMINEEGGIDPEQFRMEAMFDRMDAVGKGILGLTIQCGQCHSHKYDPLTQRDYYRLFAYLNNCHEATAAVYTPDEQVRRTGIFRRIQEIEDDLRHRRPGWDKELAAWEQAQQQGRPAWKTVRPELDASGGQKHTLLPDDSILAQGYAPTKHTTEFTAKTDLPQVTAVRLELLNDPNLPRGGPGRSMFGLFALTEFRVVAAPADHPEQKKEIKIASATANANPAEQELAAIFDDKSKRRRVTGPVAYAIDGKDETAWSIDIGPGRGNVSREAVFVFDKPVSFPKGTELTFKLTQNHGGWNSDDNQNNNLGRFRFWVTGAPAPAADPLPAAARQALAVPRERRTPAQQAALFSAWRTTVPEWRQANEQIEGLWKSHPEGSTQLVLQEREAPRPTHVLKRGDFLRPSAAAAPGVPDFLNPLPGDAPADRRGLARWLTDRQAPTTARVIVNRTWQGYFGSGLVSTPEDFGTQGDLPTHAELLDWLAVELMEHGWSLKHLHRLIVESATYRQSSKVTPALLARDPFNRLLARGPRFRVDAESVRDVALAASGLLNPKVGGPSVHPPISQFLMQPPASYGPKTWTEDTGPDRYRRSLYVFRFRSVPYPPLQAFDAPNGDFACVQRPRSNTPLQALTAMNEPLFVECARGLAGRALREAGPGDDARLTHAFRLCVARPPSPEELAVLRDTLSRERARFQAPGAKPADLVAGSPPLPAEVAPPEAAAWVALARVLLNLDETVTKD